MSKCKMSLHFKLAWRFLKSMEVPVVVCNDCALGCNDPTLKQVNYKVFD